MGNDRSFCDERDEQKKRLVDTRTINLLMILGVAMKGVLKDIRILDFGRFVACPYCGMLLADMGAEVIRVERTGGEEDRTIGLISPEGENMSFPAYGRNKKGITLNLLNNTEAREVLADLVKQVDVVIHNFTPKAAKMMGLSYNILKQIKPDIILTAISCFGSEGPYSDRTGFDFIAQAMSGAMKTGGFPDKPPVRSFINPIDHGTGLAGALGTLLALRHRDQTGEGQKVDLSLLQTALSFVAPAIAEADVMGIPRPIIGNRAPYMSPSDLYKCKDGYVFIATIMNTLWRRLVKVIGHEELLDDPDLTNDLSRYEERARIDPLVEEWAARHTKQEIVELLEEARIPCGPVLHLEEVSDDPHVQATRMLEYTDLEIPGFENVPSGGILTRLSKTPGAVIRRAPRVGEHNQEIYKGWLKYDNAQMDQLEKEKAI